MPEGDEEPREEQPQEDKEEAAPEAKEEPKDDKEENKDDDRKEDRDDRDEEDRRDEDDDRDSRRREDRDRSPDRDRSKGRDRCALDAGTGGSLCVDRSRSRDRSPAPQKSQDDGFGRKCYIGNLDYRTDKYYLREKFERCGRITDVFVPQDQQGRPRGFAFVTFESSREADDAVKEMDRREIDGRVIQVNIARERPPIEQSRASRERYSGGGSRGGPCKKIYVGNLPQDVRESEVEDLFYKCGRIVRIDLKQVSRPPAFAFVEFEDDRDAEDAVRKFNGYKFDRETLRVELANGGR